MHLADPTHGDHRWLNGLFPPLECWFVEGDGAAVQVLCPALQLLVSGIEVNAECLGVIHGRDSGRWHFSGGQDFTAVQCGYGHHYQPFFGQSKAMASAGQRVRHGDVAFSSCCRWRELGKLAANGFHPDMLG